MRRAGIVLCGGRSQRMGRPKARLPWFGQSLLEHVVERLSPCVDEVLVVTAPDLPVAERTLRPGTRVVVDREAGRGPLAALRDGLAAARAERVFVTATDAPFLTAAAVEALFARAEAIARSGPERVVVPRAAGFLQVLSAVYPRAAAAREAAALLEGAPAAAAPGREASPMRLLERLGFEALDAPDADAVAADDSDPGAVPPVWTSFNTPDAYLALARLRDPGACATVEWPGQPPRPVPIARLGEILRSSAPPGFAVDDARVLAGLEIVLQVGAGAGGGAGSAGFRDREPALRLAGVGPEALALPVGPGERVRIRTR